MHSKTRYPVLATAALLLLLASGCIRKISGVYKDANNIMSLDFQPDGRVYSRIMGVPVVSN